MKEKILPTLKGRTLKPTFREKLVQIETWVVNGDIKRIFVNGEEVFVEGNNCIICGEKMSIEEFKKQFNYNLCKK